MRVSILLLSWAVLLELGTAGWPESPAVFFPRSNIGGGVMMGLGVCMVLGSALLFLRRSLVSVVFSGVLFVLGMLPFVGMLVEQSRL